MDASHEGWRNVFGVINCGSEPEYSISKLSGRLSAFEGDFVCFKGLGLAKHISSQHFFIAQLYSITD
jgi:hypothetical protein